jgi:predicted phosphodiesterase
MIERTVILPDVHLTDSGYAFPYGLVKKFIKGYKPDEIIILGDFMDNISLSHWIEDKKRPMEGRRYKKECEVANRELDFLQANSKKVVYLEGNHEFWTEMYLDKNPNMCGILEIPIVLDLKERGIRYLHINKLYKKGKIYFTHGCYATKYHANKMLQTYGCCICYGHTHNAQTHMMNMKMQEPIMAYGLGCLCDHAPFYLRNRPANWINQFAVMESDEKGFNLTPINITRKRFIWGGGVK